MSVERRETSREVCSLDRREEVQDELLVDEPRVEPRLLGHMSNDGMARQ